jgi:DNA-binding SARP family transcriptional activator
LTRSRLRASFGWLATTGEWRRLTGNVSSLRQLSDLATAGRDGKGRPLQGADEAVRLGLLGGFELEVGHQPRVVAVPFRVQRLVAFLALRDRPLHRAYVSGRLWMDASQEQAFGSLRATLWTARRLPCPLIEASSTHIALGSGVRVDAHELAACARHVLQHARPVVRDDVDQLALAGDLLPDWFEDWVVEEAERLHQLRLLALETAADDLLAERRFSEAAMAALAALRGEPLRESACLRLVRACLGMGNVAEARERFRTFRARLLSELDLEPSPSIQQLLAGYISPLSQGSTPGSSPRAAITSRSR